MATSDGDTVAAVQWFNRELSSHMNLYADVSSMSCLLTENYGCDIIATSRVYSDPGGTVKRLMPPNSWDCKEIKPLGETVYETNACSAYSFDTFGDLMSYVRTMYVVGDRCPFFQLKAHLHRESLSQHVDVDREPVRRAAAYARDKIYLSL